MVEAANESIPTDYYITPLSAMKITVVNIRAATDSIIAVIRYIPY